MIGNRDARMTKAAAMKKGDEREGETINERALKTLVRATVTLNKSKAKG